MGFGQRVGLIGLEAHQVIGAVALGQLAGIGLGGVSGIGCDAHAGQIHLGPMGGDGGLLVGVARHGHLIDQSLLTGDEVDQR